MSTRSRIGVLISNDEIRSIYCHFDGYPAGVGRELLTSYTDPDKINTLLDLGDLSVLGSELGEDQGTDWFDKRYATIGASYNSTDPRHNWCLAYNRDRGETNVTSIIHSIDDWPDDSSEYHYLWKDSQWYWRNTYGEKPKRFTKLTKNTKG